MSEDKVREQNISGLSFRDLAKDSDFSKTGSEEYIFIDKEIYSEKDLTWINRVGNFLANRFNTRRGALAFLIDFLNIQSLD